MATVDLGRTGAPRRLRFWAVDGKWPTLRSPSGRLARPGRHPAGSWPRLGPIGQSSWPVQILPPAEGSLDPESVLGLIAVLTDTPPLSRWRIAASITVIRPSWTRAPPLLWLSIVIYVLAAVAAIAGVGFGLTFRS